LISGIEADAFEVIRGAETRATIFTTNPESPSALDERSMTIKPALEEAVSGHSAL
jgi:hypothetical protein